MIAKTFFSNYEPGSKIHKTTYLGNINNKINLLCDCGKQFTINFNSLVKNNGKYMCKKCYALRDSEKFDPDWGYRAAFKRIKSDAKKANREFFITLEEFKILSQLPCHYCNSKSLNTITYQGKNNFTKRSFSYNGLDRINNKLGYVKNNILPCCLICNRAKNSMDYDEFINWINNLVKYREYHG